MCPINITEICTRIHYRMYHQSVCVWWSPPKLFFNGHFGRPSSNSHQLKSRINYRDTLPAPRKNGVTLVAWGWERALLSTGWDGHDHRRTGRQCRIRINNAERISSLQQTNNIDDTNGWPSGTGPGPGYHGPPHHNRTAIHRVPKELWYRPPTLSGPHNKISKAQRDTRALTLGSSHVPVLLLLGQWEESPWRPQ